MLYMLRFYVIFTNCICICVSYFSSIFILCITVTNLALRPQDLNKLTTTTSLINAKTLNKL